MNSEDYSQSRGITDAQVGIHDQLHTLVEKHANTAYRKPIQEHNHHAFETLQNTLHTKKPKYAILDSCCGTGLSTHLIAKAHPEAIVFGVDQSLKRLSKEVDYQRDRLVNCFYLRANCEDIWRLCVDAKIQFDKHFILYPNPYPKAKHMPRRWHGHAVFPYLPKLSRSIEVRSNWKVYVDEFASAWQQLTGQDSPVKALEIEKPLTLFETKYHGNQQALWGWGNAALFQP